MKLITQTYDADQWQLVPKVMDKRMFDAANNATADTYWSVNDVYEYAIAAAPQPEPLSPWRDIESAPKDETLIVMINAEGDCGVGWFEEHEDDYGNTYPVLRFKSRYFGNGRISDAISDPTHWMPLPQTPTAPGAE